MVKKGLVFDFDLHHHGWERAGLWGRAKLREFSRSKGPGGVQLEFYTEFPHYPQSFPHWWGGGILPPQITSNLKFPLDKVPQWCYKNFSQKKRREDITVQKLFAAFGYYFYFYFFSCAKNVKVIFAANKATA